MFFGHALFLNPENIPLWEDRKSVSKEWRRTYIVHIGNHNFNPNINERILWDLGERMWGVKEKTQFHFVLGFLFRNFGGDFYIACRLSCSPDRMYFFDVNLVALTESLHSCTDSFGHIYVYIYIYIYIFIFHHEPEMEDFLR